MSRALHSFVVVLAAVLYGGLLPPAAFAHEHREVGKYVFVVGFINEPAFQGEQNGIYVKITEKERDKPVEGLADTLKAQVIHGANTRDIELHQAWGETWGEKGVYTAVFYPTATGDYTFRFFGDIAGTQVDEQFTSSPEGFDSVASPAEFQFPAKVAGPDELSMQLAAAQSATRTALLLGGAGLAVGVVGLITAFLALRR